MTELFKCQEISFDRYGSIPKLSAISCNALVAIVSTSENIVHILQRNAVDELFRVSENSYKSHGTAISAISIQEAGTFAVSGDEGGNIHYWRPDTPNNSKAYKFDYGCVTGIAVSNKYILASFLNKVTGKGKMVLIDKGLNVEESWTVVKEYDGEFSLCTLSEHGNPAKPQILYYSGSHIIHEPNPISQKTSTNKIPLEAKPWCMRRNMATSHLLVYEILIDRDILLWAPNKGFNIDNPTVYKMISKDELKINKSVSMSAVVSSKIVLVCIFDGKVYVIDMRRSGDIEREEKQTEERIPSQPENTVLERMSQEITALVSPIDSGESGCQDVKTPKNQDEETLDRKECNESTGFESECLEPCKDSLSDGDIGTNLTENIKVKAFCSNENRSEEEFAIIINANSNSEENMDSEDMQLENEITKNSFWGVFVE